MLSQGTALQLELKVSYDTQSYGSAKKKTHNHSYSDDDYGKLLNSSMLSLRKQPVLYLNRQI